MGVQNESGAGGKDLFVQYSESAEAFLKRIGVIL
jgi:hypothetical protein